MDAYPLYPSIDPVAVEQIVTPLLVPLQTQISGKADQSDVDAVSAKIDGISRGQSVQFSAALALILG